MQDDERAIFGGIVIDDKGGNHAKASSLIIRITDNHCISSDSQKSESYKSNTRSNHPYLLFPLRSVSRGIIYPSPTSTFTLTIQRKPLIKAPDIGIKKILVFSLLASLGSRSRRGFGSLWPTEINYFGKSVPIPTDKNFFTNLDVFRVLAISINSSSAR